MERIIVKNGLHIQTITIFKEISKTPYLWEKIGKKEKKEQGKKKRKINNKRKDYKKRKAIKKTL
jgi:hypothetical protein